MWVSDKWQDYELIDCGRGEKLERWGDRILVRPDPQAIWDTPRDNPLWRRPNARYARSSTGGGQWEKKDVPETVELCWALRKDGLDLPLDALSDEECAQALYDLLAE